MNPMEIPHWDGLTVGDFVDAIGVSPNLFETLRAIEKYNIEAVDVLVNGHWIGPNDYPRAVHPEDAIERLRVRGIAWDDSDWEWGEEVTGNDDPAVVMQNLSNLRQAFHDALAERDY